MIGKNNVPVRKGTRHHLVEADQAQLLTQPDFHSCIAPTASLDPGPAH